MIDSHSAMLAIGIALPAVAAIVASRANNAVRARTVAIASVAITLVLLLEILRGVSVNGAHASSAGAWLVADGLNAVPMALFAGLALVTLMTVPRRDLANGILVNVLTLTSATLLCYAAGNLVVFFAGWIIPALPFALRCGRTTRFAIVASAVLLVAGIFAPAWAFGLLAAAALVREFIFPFHRSALGLFEDSRISVGALVINSHLGAFLLARFVMPAFPVAGEALFWFGALALFTSLYTAILGLAERQPRRVLATLMISQSSAIVAGLATTSHEGVAGALLQWIVLGIASTVLVAVYRGVEARVERAYDGLGFLGFASSMPRMAVFFAISALTIVGLPGTLGFAGEDLLLHGVLATYTWWGAALPVAIALNAYHAFRLFAHLFLGNDEVTRNTASDALPRERWAMAACITLLVWGGLAPHQFVSLQSHAVGSLAASADASSHGRP